VSAVEKSLKTQGIGRYLTETNVCLGYDAESALVHFSQAVGQGVNLDEEEWTNQ
jgi:hypothetical protein